MYNVDYTQDFAGTMHKEELVEYFIKNFNFNFEGDGLENYCCYTILNNEESVGRNVLTYTYKDHGNFHRVKFYNKIVSNLEAGEVRNTIGGHVADYACSSNERLRDLFSSKIVQQKGVTRIEVSIYGFQEEITKEKGNNAIQTVLNLVTREEKLFYIQPAKNQWNALAEKIDKCLCLVDLPNSTLYMGWYGNSLTGRIVGVKSPIKTTQEQTENLILWHISDFGFRACPIYRVDILDAGKKKHSVGNITLLH